MQMGAGASAGIAHQADNLAAFNKITFFNQLFTHMSVVGLVTVTMGQGNILTSSPGTGDKLGNAIRRGINFVAGCAPEINPGVKGVFIFYGVNATTIS